MSDVEIVHPVPVDEVEAWERSFATTLLLDVSTDDFPRRVERRRRAWLPERAWGVRDGGRWVGTLATEPKKLTVPGPAGATGELDADGLTTVTVAATHRRHGLLTRMVTESLQAASDRGDPLAILVAAEWPIYGRFGYAPAVFSADYTYFTRLRGSTVTPVEGGTVRQVEPAELAAIAPDVFDAARRRRVGQVDRPGNWWPGRLGVSPYEPVAAERGNWILHETASGPDGLACWRVDRDFGINGDMGAGKILEFVAASDVAYRNLWAHLGGTDLLGEIIWQQAAVDEQLRWLLPDGRALRQTYAGDYLWLRLLDVPVALSARAYSTPGRLVIEVMDPAPGRYGAGRYLLDATADGASCTRTSASPDIVLSQRVLAAIYLGGHSLRAVAAGGGVEEVTAGSVVRLDAMFATLLAPWNATGF